MSLICSNTWLFWSRTRSRTRSRTEKNARRSNTNILKFMQNIVPTLSQIFIFSCQNSVQNQYRILNYSPICGFQLFFVVNIM